jgi:hypothetical protein
MYLAYSLLLSLGLFVLIPHFLFQALAHGKYIAGPTPAPRRRSSDNEKPLSGCIVFRW